MIADLKLKEYENAVNDCNIVLNKEENNVKALHRRATAYQCMEDNSNKFNKVILVLLFLEFFFFFIYEFHI